MKDLYDTIENTNESAYEDVDLEEIKKPKEPKTNIYVRKNNNAFGVQQNKKKVIHPMLRGVTTKELRRGIIFSEVLGKPKGLL